MWKQITTAFYSFLPTSIQECVTSAYAWDQTLVCSNAISHRSKSLIGRRQIIAEDCSTNLVSILDDTGPYHRSLISSHRVAKKFFILNVLLRSFVE